MTIFDYTIHTHAHRLAAWSASRAASVKNYRFSVQQGVGLLESCGFNERLNSPEQLPRPSDIDQRHLGWRQDIIARAKNGNLAFTHGVAAKLINCYLKVKFVCGGYYEHPHVAALHPPIDRLLLAEMADRNFGGDREFWRHAERSAWSKLSSEQYKALITRIRFNLNGEPFWKVEYFWSGAQ